MGSSVPRAQVPTERLSDVLEVFARFEADRAPRRNTNFLTSARVAADAALPGLHLEYPDEGQFQIFSCSAVLSQHYISSWKFRLPFLISPTLSFFHVQFYTHKDLLL